MTKTSAGRMNAVRMKEGDSVAVLVEDVAAGEPVVFLTDEGDDTVVTAQKISYGHKVALRPMTAGEPVIKYGERMGIATKDIALGQHVHVHNVRGLETVERGMKQDAGV